LTEVGFMKRFQFNLQKVLDVRNIEEEKAENKLQQARQRAREIENELHRLNGIQNELYDFLRSNSTLTVKENINARNYIHNHRVKIREVENILDKQEDHVHDCQEKYIQRKRNKELIEKLKEKKQEIFYKDYLKKEQKILDEISQHIGGK